MSQDYTGPKINFSHFYWTDKSGEFSHMYFLSSSLITCMHACVVEIAKGGRAMVGLVSNDGVGKWVGGSGV